MVNGSFKKSKLFKVFFLNFCLISDTLPSIGAGQGLELAPLVPKSSAAASSATKDSVITLDYVSQWRVTTPQPMINAKLSPYRFGPAMKTGSSRQFIRYPTTYMQVSSLHCTPLLGAGEANLKLTYSPLPNISNVSFIFFQENVPLFFAYLDC